MFLRALFLICFLSFAATAQAQEKVVIGRVERAILQDYGIKMKARIDSGAGLTSVHAKIIEVKKSKSRKKAERIVFELFDKKGKAYRDEKEVIEWVHIKRKGSTGFIKRPMVRMDICLGGKQIETRVNLADRSDFIYPLLIGRNTLKAGDFLIDPAQTHMEHPDCKL